MKSKLTAEQVEQIKQQHAYGRKRKLIAKEFGVSTAYIYALVHGLRGKTLLPESQPNNR